MFSHKETLPNYPKGKQISLACRRNTLLSRMLAERRYLQRGEMSLKLCGESDCFAFPGMLACTTILKLASCLRAHAEVLDHGELSPNTIFVSNMDVMDNHEDEIHIRSMMKWCDRMKLGP